MNRPRIVAGIVGTRTDVGKTWVAVELLSAARRRGQNVSARKPAQSFAPDGPPTDADILSAATDEDVTKVCDPSLSFAAAMAPPMAAGSLGVAAPSLGTLVSSVRWPPSIDLGIVETAGGLRSPVAVDGDSLDLLLAVEADHVILVADAGLGTINDCRLATEALRPLRPIVILNRFDPQVTVHELNREWLNVECGMETHAVVQGSDWAERVVDLLAGTSGETPPR